MTSALVGHTGFVGETLKRHARFDALYRSTDLEAIAGRSFDLLVCAGAPAAKWIANRDPEGDRANLARLMANLARASARRFVLVSTVDVYPDPVGVDESVEIVADPRNAYGANRLELERFCRERFGARIVRLPALFGAGLRKNAIYDLLHDNGLEKLHPDARFQFYDMALLWGDLQRILESDVELVNVATEPIALGDVAERIFGRTLVAPEGARAARYDFRTRHARLWARSDGYAYGAEETWARLRAFVSAERARTEGS